MTRPHVSVRDARADDLPAVVALWTELRDMGSRLERAMPPVTEDGARERLLAIDADPAARAMLAVVGGEVVGMMVLTQTAYAPLFDQSAVHVHYLQVRDGARRRGVGKALVAAAAAYAEDVGAEHVITSVLPHLRETNRFYARLGFGPVVVRRSVPTAILRRRLAAEGVSATPDDVVVRRRSLRRVRAAVARVNN